MKHGIFWLLLCGTIMAAVFALPVQAEEASNKVMQDEINALKQMVLELQKRIQYLEAEQLKFQNAEVCPPKPKIDEKKPQRTAKKTDKTVPVKDASDRLASSANRKATTAQTRQRGEMSQDIGTQPPAPLELGGHEVRVGIAGAVQVDVIHDFNALGLNSGDGVAREFITADIPVGGPACDITNRTALSPNQSYLTGWAETDTPWGPFRIYADVNLMGSTTEPQFQIYKAYGQWGWLKAGLDYTLWINQAAIPDTLDFEGPNSVPENRFTQVSLKIPLRPSEDKGELFFIIGVEDAQADMTLPTGVTPVDQFPAVIGKFSYEPDWAHVELAGLYRRLKAEDVGYEQSIDGWGVAFSGNINTWGQDSFIWGLEYGDALGAYIQDTSGLGLDAAPISATNATLRAISAFGAWGAYQHWWRRSLRSTATYGIVRLDSDFDVLPSPAGAGTYKQTQYASMNLVWSPWPPFDVGLEYLYGHRRVTDATAVDGSTTGHDHRLQFTMRWNFDWER